MTLAGEKWGFDGKGKKAHGGVCLMCVFVCRGVRVCVCDIINLFICAGMLKAAWRIRAEIENYGHLARIMQAHSRRFEKEVWSTDWRTDWLIDCLNEWLVDWLIYSSIHHFIDIKSYTLTNFCVWYNMLIGAVGNRWSFLRCWYSDIACVHVTQLLPQSRVFLIRNTRICPWSYHSSRMFIICDIMLLGTWSSLSFVDAWTC